MSGIIFGVVLMVALFVRATSVEPTIDELKARVESVSPGERPKLCVHIAQRQLAETSKSYSAAEDEKAQAALADVILYSERARDYSLQTHKYQKQAEIAVREMTRKLTEIKHTLGQQDQAPVQDAILHLERVRDDLLAAMFPKGAK